MDTHCKLWIDIEGNLIPVQDSHEEWANRHGHELEALLDAGWVRVQDVPPAYLYLDFRLPLKAGQAVAVGRLLLDDGFDRIIVEVAGVVLEFGDTEEAMGCVMGRQ
jgi:hypothetical protein